MNIEESFDEGNWYHLMTYSWNHMSLERKIKLLFTVPDLYSIQEFLNDNIEGLHQLINQQQRDRLEWSFSHWPIYEREVYHAFEMLDEDDKIRYILELHHVSQSFNAYLDFYFEELKPHFEIDQRKWFYLGGKCLMHRDEFENSFWNASHFEPNYHQELINYLNSINLIWVQQLTHEQRVTCYLKIIGAKRYVKHIPLFNPIF